MGIRTDTVRGLVTLAAMAIALVAGVLAGWYVFVDAVETTTDILGILLTLLLAGILAKLAGNLVSTALDDYNVAEVTIEGPISRDGGRPSPLASPLGLSADELVEQITRADEDPKVDALLLELNTPGGEVLPSDDIRRAAEDFDGPTIAYATDVCASGGYWIASGCDELWAHDASIVGSIGVMGSRPNAAGLADKLGISYERFAAGEYKDAGYPLKELDEEDRTYLQGIVDDLYEQFVDTVAAGRDIDPATIRETEARVFVGPDAASRDLVDELGTREDVVDRLESRLGVPAEIRAFEPTRHLTERIRIGATSVAFAAGAGVASVLADDEFDLRV